MGLLAIAALSALVGTSTAQDDILTFDPPSLWYEKKDVREILRTVFRINRETYWLDIDLDTRISLKVDRAYLALVIPKIEAAADVSFTRDDKVYRVTSRGPAQTFQVNDADAVELLQAILKKAGRKIRISPKVRGQATLRLKNARFGTTLTAIAEQARATIRVENAVYIVEPGGKPARYLPGIPFDTVASNPAPITLTAENEDVRAVIRRLFKDRKESFTLDPAVKGRVTVELQGAEFAEGLKQILEPVGAQALRQMELVRVVPKL